MSYNFLDKTGLAYFWSKIKAKIPTKTSQLTNDNGFVNSSGNVATATTLQTYLYNRSDATNIWAKIATTTITKKDSQWEEKHAFLFIKGTHNSNYNQNGIIAIDATGNGRSGIVGSYNAQFMTATKDIDLSNFYIEYLNGDSETDGVVNFWVKIATNRYASWQVKILQNNGWTIKGATATTTAMPTTGYTGKNAVLSGNSLKATQDSDGNAINTTYYKASNPNGYTSNTGTITGIKMNGASKGTSGVVDLGTVITAHQDISGKQDKLTAGSNIQITNNTISATDTTYSSKTAASGGTDVSLVTTGEKYNWNNKTSNTGTVTSVSVKMNGATKGTVTTSGTIDLGTVITAHQDISGKQDKLTSQTAYTSKGSATKVPQITTNSLGQVTNITEVDIEGGSGLVAYSSIPIGGGCDYYGTVLPDGFMWADGSAISRTTYAELFAVIGTTYGAGDGSTTFNLPDKRERVSVMKKEGGTFDTLGKTGGEEKHKLTNSELSSHGHQVRIWNNAGNGSTSPARTFNSNGDQTTSSLGVQFRSVNVSGVNSSTWVSSRIVAAQGGIGDQAASADKAGGDQAHNNLQPYFVCNYIIRVLNISTTMSATTKDIAAVKSEILADLYPVGSIYMSINNTNPSTMFGGTWEQLKDRFLLGAGDTYTAGNTGGEANHKLTKAELPNYTLYNASHSHTIFTYRNGAGNGAIINGQQDNYNVKTGTFSQINGTTIKVDSGGSNTPHNNMPPYLAVYMWKRTA